MNNSNVSHRLPDNNLDFNALCRCPRRNDGSSFCQCLNTASVKSKDKERRYSQEEESWTVEDVRSMMDNSIDPVGKFLTTLNLSPQEIIRRGLMKRLKFAPKKVRGKYGPRKDLTAEERKNLSKERNRVHARATRMRKKIFKEVNI